MDLERKFREALLRDPKTAVDGIAEASQAHLWELLKASLEELKKPEHGAARSEVAAAFLRKYNLKMDDLTVPPETIHPDPLISASLIGTMLRTLRSNESFRASASAVEAAYYGAVPAGTQKFYATKILTSMDDDEGSQQ